MKSIYHKAVEKWGKDLQLTMMMEECAELIKAISKWKRGKLTEKEVLGEVIDVQIMCSQMYVVFSYDTAYYHNNEMYKEKIEKLRRLVEDEDQP